MLNQILNLICPHHCSNCGKIGHILCVDCKNYITKHHINHCLKCGVVVKSSCKTCRLSYQKSWTLSYRNHVIRRLIDLYKFHSVRAAALPIAEMLATITPKFTANTIIVPIPTSHPHIRQRGFDHTALLARHLARLKECQTSPVLTRRTNTRQFGSSRAKRLAQAKQAFSCDQKLNSKTHYVILDDIYTSGASIHAAADLLRANSARKISVVILARQPDSDSDSNSDSNSKEPPRQTKFILK